MRSKSQARKLTQSGGESDSDHASGTDSTTGLESDSPGDEEGDGEEEDEEGVDDNSDSAAMETQPSKLSLNSNNSMVAALMPNHSALYVLDQSIMPSELYLGQSQCPSPEVTTLQRLGLGLGLTLGVWTKVKIPSGTHFGPFIGKIRPLPLDRQYAWEIAQVTDVHGTTCSMWVDATEAGIGNWMKYVRTSSNSSMRNMKAVLLNSQVYYRATKDIHEGEELLLKDRKLIPCNQKSHSIHHHHHHHHHHHPEDITTTSSAPSTPTLGTTTDSTGGQPVSSHFSTYNNNNNNTKTTKESHTPSSTTSTTGQQPVQHQAKAEEHRTANDDVPSSCPPGAASSPTTTVAESALNQLDGTSRRVSSGCEGGGGGSEGPVFLGQKGGHSATRNCEATNNSNANTEEEEEEDDEEDLEEEEEEEDLEEEEEDDEEDEEEDLEEDDDEDRRPATHKSKSEDGKPLTSGLSVDSCESEFKQHFQQGLECAACCQTFGDVAKLEEHLVVVHYARESGLGEYKCGQCPKIFNWKSNLLRHQSTHEDGRRYSCENCHKIFTDPSNLQRHIRSQHIGARSHACSECGKTFATSSGLKQHTHIHSSVKPFQCEVCLKSYTQFSNLCRHKRMHADCRMQIKCHKCGQAFSTVTSLSKHKRFCEGPPPPAALVAHPNVVSPLTNGCGLLNLAGTGAATNDANVAPPPPMNLSHPAAQLMFYPRPGFSFYPPSMVAYPMFPGAASAIPPHPSLVAATANPLFVQTALTAKKPDSPDSSSVPGGATAANGSATVPPSPKVAEPTGHKEKRGSEGSDSDISDDVSSACDDIDLSTGSELDSESDADARQRDRSRRKSATSPKKLCTNNNGAPTNVMPNLFVPRRENSPKQGAVYPAEPTLKSSLHPGVNGLSKPLSVNCSDSAAVATDMPYDLSVNSKAPHMSPAAKPPAPEGSAGKDEEQPLDLRVDHKKSVSVAEGRHKTHVFGKDERAAPPMPPPEKPLPMIPAPTIAAPPPPVPAFAEPPPSSPTKFPMACPRPIHPLMIDALYRMDKPKFPAFQAPERLLPAFPPRYPFLSPLMNLNGSNAAFDLLRSQMEKMGKPYHDVLSPHMNKLKERYSCKFCGKIFPRSANLTRHLRTHTGEQPYKCKYCERSFSISSNLQRHVRNIHNKEKPFKCPLCDRCFGQQTNLDRHLKKHESDGPTILDDSPKSAELNDKDDTYFDEIRNFIGKVTERDTTALVAATSAHPPLTAAHLFDKLDCGAASANLPIPPDHHHHHHHHHHLRLNLGAIANERMTADKNPADEDDPDEKPPSVKRHRSSADSDLAESRSTTSPRTRKDGGETLVNGCKGLPCPKTMAYEVRMKVNKKYPEDEEEDDGDDAVDEYQRREVNRLVGGATESKPPQEKMVDV